jgi:hypothetical protein
MLILANSKNLLIWPTQFHHRGALMLVKYDFIYIPIASYHRHKFAFDSYTNSPFSMLIIYESAMLLGYGTL